MALQKAASIKCVLKELTKGIGILMPVSSGVLEDRCII